MTTVYVGSQEIEFPDDMPPEQIEEILRREFPAPANEPVEAEAQPDLANATGIQGGVDAVATLGRNMGAEAAAGLAGLADTAIRGSEFGAETVGKVRETLGGGPQTKQGAAMLETVGDLVEKVTDFARMPISGLVGIGELIAGQGPEQAAETIKSVQEIGLGPTLGNRIVSEGGSPMAATLAHVAPDAALAVTGMKLSRPVLRHSPAKQKIAEKIMQGSTDAETATLRLPAPQAQATSKVGEVVNKGASKLAEYMQIGGEAITDTKAVAAIKQGFDEGVIAAVKGASPADKSKMLQMVDTMEKAQKNKRFAMTNRPTDVAGNALMDRVRVVMTKNREAGKQLDAVASRLKGKRVDVSGPVSQFVDDLDGFGVSLSDDLRPIFQGSDLEGIPGAEAAVSKIVARMSNTRVPDAYDVHRLKKFIDNTVSYGKNAEGLEGEIEVAIKRLRRSLDGELDARFPEYNRVNTQYSETIGAINALQDAVGKKIDLTGPNADKATGTVLRRLMGNVQSRANLIDAIDEVNGVAGKFQKFDDDLMTQVLFADELDNVFGPVARTSFRGEIQRSAAKGAELLADPKGGVIRAALKKAGEKASGVNNENAYKAIRELLSEPNP